MLNRLLAVLLTLLALIASGDAVAHRHGGVGPAGSGGTYTQVFTYPNFTSATGLSTAACGQINGAVVSLTATTCGSPSHTTGAVYYTAQQNINSFTTDFTFQLHPHSSGFHFVVQNTNATNNPLAHGVSAIADANMLGYSAGYDGFVSQFPMFNSIGIKFDLDCGNQSNGQTLPYACNATALELNGGTGPGPTQTNLNNDFVLIPEEDLNPYGIDLHAGDLMAAHIVYDGSLLVMTLKDTVTSAQSRHSWPVTISTPTGSSSAWVGFAAGIVAGTPGNQDVASWTYGTGYFSRLATPTFSVTPGQYTGTQSVSLSGPAGSAIYYTTNGLSPTTSSTLYTTAITVSANTLIQAVAVESGFTDSLVAQGNYQIQSGALPFLNFPSGFSANGLVTMNEGATLSSTAIRLVSNSSALQVGSAWYVTPVSVATFTEAFQIQMVTPSSGNKNGIARVWQAQVPAGDDATALIVSGGPFVVGQNAANPNGMGYYGILRSVALVFDQSDGSHDQIGVYTNGVVPSGSSVATGFNLNNGHLYNVTDTYSGTSLAVTITDVTTSATYSHTFTIDIPGTLGTSTGWIGFTAASYAGDNDFLNNWTYHN